MTEHRKANQCRMRWENRISCNEIAGHLGVHVNCRNWPSLVGASPISPHTRFFGRQRHRQLPEPEVVPFPPPWAREVDELYLRHADRSDAG